MPAVRLSVITPSFNQSRFIERTIRSVLDQELSAIELLVMDGGSTDGTVDILRAYSDRCFWVSESDKGQAHAINKGLSIARGDIIGWLNSDDIYRPGALETVLRFFDAHPDIDLVYGDAEFIDEDDEIIAPYYTEPWNLERLADVCYICQPAAFFRQSVTTRYGPLDESLHYCMDYEYW
ncbi:MAG: glycosyltransferase, partial [Chloroflexi bacterium]|nr:glycosyltransferase [Chloroflexota bacterium]